MRERIMTREIDFDTPDISVQLRATEGGIKGDYWPLATLTGGIDKLTVKQRQTKSGLKTTIEFVTVGGDLISSSYNRTKVRRSIAARLLADAKAG
jgi:hypothetical protein